MAEDTPLFEKQLFAGLGISLGGESVADRLFVRDISDCLARLGGLFIQL
jgi:hypothetical protein